MKDNDSTAIREVGRGPRVVGVDASRNRSGGARAHVIGLLTCGDPTRFGIERVHLWSYDALLAAVPERPWLVKHGPRALAGSLVRQVLWQRFQLPREARRAGVDIMLDTSAGTVSRFWPSVTMSRDMLSYEPGEMQRFGWSRSRLRLELLRLLQNRSLRHAAGAIFLSGHAAEMIQRACGRLPRVTFIPHGVGEEFRHQPRTAIWPVDGARPVRCVYVSRAALYKHQWMVVRAIAALRDRGNAVTLTLIGGGCGRAQQRLDAEIDAVDPERSFVDQRPFVPHGDLPAHLADADVFVFASSCENLPNTLIEAMAVGLPIACSDRGPMPEVLQDGGVYFDPEDPTTIAEAVARLLADAELRQRLAARARELAAAYSWRRCSDETWAFLVSTYRHCQAGRARQS